MKVIGLIGSPRSGGNTERLVQQILAGAAERGADTRSYSLATMKIAGCQGCYACKTDGKCVQQDDMQTLYTEIDQADVVVFGTPLYMGQMTSQAKAFVDRLTPYLKPDFTTRLAGKKRDRAGLHAGQPRSHRLRPLLSGNDGHLQVHGLHAQGDRSRYRSPWTHRHRAEERRDDQRESAGRAARRVVGVFCAHLTLRILIVIYRPNRTLLPHGCLAMRQ